MEILTTLKKSGLPVVYSHSRKKNVKLPYIAFIGSGQDIKAADNTYYYSRNNYQIEYYYIKKNEAAEAAIEQALLEDGWPYSKTEDIYIDDEEVFVIYYHV